EAVAAFRAVLEVCTIDRLPRDWAGTQRSLGSVLGTLGRREGSRRLLGEAIDAYRAALEVYTKDDVPLDWARTQNELGNALRALGVWADDPESLADAVA